MPSDAPRSCATWGTLSDASIAACPTCGRLVAPKGALGPAPQATGAIFGLLAGPVVGLLYGIVLFMFFPAVWYDPRRPHWFIIAVVLVLRAIPLAAGLAAGAELIRRGRLGLGWFVVSTGFFAVAPAAACDVARILARPN